MKDNGNNPSKGTSFWGIVSSITLHVVVIGLILFWGFKGASQFSGSSGPIQVSISSLDAGDGGDGLPAKKPQSQPKKTPPKKVESKPAPTAPPKKEVKAPLEPPKEEPKKQEPEKEVVKKQEVKKEPEKPKPTAPPKKEEKPKEVVKKEPEKKEAIPLEKEKKVEKKEEPKKQEKKEEKKVAEKPKPTDKPKPKKEANKSKHKNLDKERSQVLKDIQRQKVLDQLSGGSESEQPEELDEPIGEERRLAMADAEEAGLETSTEKTGTGTGSKGGPSVSPVIVNLYNQQVHRKISRNWSLPPSVPQDGSLAAGILFKVGSNGKVHDVRVNESSGNRVFDEYCVKTIYKSSPLPPPPSELAKEAEDAGVIITFRNDP